ncbi:MAG: hypothetical protein GYB64_05230 [Chloroflexi bacterium]|nr:hypothetical protein [Chloroflexota bacterium]
MSSLLSDRIREWRLALPVSRDQVMLLMVAVNLFFLGLDTYLAHLISGTIVPREWIPIGFGVAGGILMVGAGLVALRSRMTANIIATVVMLASIAVGVLGTYFHLVRAALPFAPAGERLSTNLLIWGPPIAGPFAFVMVGLLGLSAAWQEDPADSGVLVLPGNVRLQLPYSKTRAYFYIVSMGILAALVSAVLDHARTGYTEGIAVFWIPLAAGVFGTVVAAMMGFIEKPTSIDFITYITTMGLMILVGVVGFYFHIQADIGARGEIVIERFLRGAPVLAPLLFANMGMLGLIALLAPKE